MLGLKHNGCKCIAIKKPMLAIITSVRGAVGGVRYILAIGTVHARLGD